MQLPTESAMRSPPVTMIVLKGVDRVPYPQVAAYPEYDILADDFGILATISDGESDTPSRVPEAPPATASPRSHSLVARQEERESMEFLEQSNSSSIDTNSFYVRTRPSTPQPALENLPVPPSYERSQAESGSRRPSGPRRAPWPPNSAGFATPAPHAVSSPQTQPFVTTPPTPTPVFDTHPEPLLSSPGIKVEQPVLNVFKQPPSDASAQPPSNAFTNLSNAFSQSPPNVFGPPPLTAFGQSSNAFGQSSNAFGQASNAFGQASSNVFGQASSNAFSLPDPSNVSQPHPSAFAQPTSNPFAQRPSNPFTQPSLADGERRRSGLLPVTFDLKKEIPEVPSEARESVVDAMRRHLKFLFHEEIPAAQSAADFTVLIDCVIIVRNRQELYDTLLPFAPFKNPMDLVISKAETILGFHAAVASQVALKKQVAKDASTSAPSYLRQGEAAGSHSYPPPSAGSISRIIRDPSGSKIVKEPYRGPENLSAFPSVSTPFVQLISRLFYLPRNESGRVPPLTFAAPSPLTPQRVPVTSGAFVFVSWQSEGDTMIEAPYTEGKDLQIGEVYIHRIPHPSIPNTKLIQAWLYLEDRWKNITTYWNDFRGMAPIIHPLTDPARYLIFRGDGGPSWVQKARYDKVRKTTYTETKAKKTSQNKTKATRAATGNGKGKVWESMAEDSEAEEEDNGEDHDAT